MVTIVMTVEVRATVSEATVEAEVDLTVDRVRVVTDRGIRPQIQAAYTEVEETMDMAEVGLHRHLLDRTTTTADNRRTEVTHIVSLTTLLPLRGSSLFPLEAAKKLAQTVTDH